MSTSTSTPLPVGRAAFEAGPRAFSVPVPALEAMLLASVVGAAAALRLLRLDLAPLSSTEAYRAFAAWQLTQGATPDWWDAPAFGTAVALFFVTFGDADAIARAVGALAGAGSVAAIWLFRPWLGRWQTPAAAALVALSPSGLAAARAVSEDAPALLATLLAGWLLLRWWERDDPRKALVLGVLAAVLLQFGYSGVAGMLALLLFSLAWYVQRPQCRALPAWLREPWHLAGGFAAASLLFSGGLLLAPPRFGFPSLTAWALHFESGPGTDRGASALVAFTGYELPALLVGVPAAVAALRRWHGDPLSAAGSARGFFAVWGLSGLLLALLGGRGDPSALCVASLPLLMLGACSIVEGCLTLDTRTFPALWRAGLGTALLLAVGYLYLSRGSASGTGPDAWMAALALAGVVAIVLAAGAATGMTRGVVAVTLAGLVALLTLHDLGRLRAPWPGMNLLSPIGIGAVADATRLARYRPDGAALTVAVDARLRQALSWQLRSTPGVAYVDRIRPGPSVVLAAQVPEAGLFMGYNQRNLPLGSTWSAAGWGRGELVRWLLIGEVPPNAGVSSRFVLLTLPREGI